MYALSTLPKRTTPSTEHPSLDSTRPFWRATECDVGYSSTGLDDRVCSGWLAVEQGLCQECMLAPLLLNIFFAAVINVAFTRFKADEYMMDVLMHLKEKTGGAGGSNCRRASPGDAVLGLGLR